MKKRVPTTFFNRRPSQPPPFMPTSKTMSTSSSRNSLNTHEALVVGTNVYTYYSIKAAEQTLGDLAHLPVCMRLLLENLLRHENDITITVEDMRSLTAFHALHKNTPSFIYSPCRILMDDETGVSVLTDLASWQTTAQNAAKIPPSLTLECSVDIVVNQMNAAVDRNADRGALLKWGEQNLRDVRVIPPGNGPSNQINLDALTPVVQIKHEIGNEVPIVVPDSVFGTDSRLLVVNSLGVLGWNVDALEIEGLLLGYPTPLSLPGVIGVKLTGKLHKGTSVTDVALAVAKVLSQNQGAGKIVEFFGSGLDHLSVPDRAIIASLAHECGARCAFFPIDALTLEHLTLTGYNADHVALVEAYTKAQGFWRDDTPHGTKTEPTFTLRFELSLDSIRPALGGPNSAYSLGLLNDVAALFAQSFPPPPSIDPLALIKHGDILVASLSSCSNTAHPIEMAIAGLLARNAAAHGLKVKPWVKTILACASPVVTTFMKTSGLLADLESIGFTPNTEASHACGTVAAINETIAQTITKNKITVCSLSTGTALPLHPLAQANYIASPALVVAYAIAGTTQTDLSTKPLGTSKEGRPVLLKDLWPSTNDINVLLDTVPLRPLYQEFKKKLLEGTPAWQQIQPETTQGFSWNPASTLVRDPPYLLGFSAATPKIENIKNAHILFLLGNHIQADTLAPVGVISPDSPAGYYLAAQNDAADSLKTFGLYTGNFEVMVRGALMGKGLQNDFFPANESAAGLTLHVPSQTTLSVFDAAQRYANEKTPLVLFAGQQLGIGHGQEWAAKSLRALGIRVVICEGFDSVFRLNLIRMGILPLQLKSGISLSELKLSGHERVNFAGIPEINRPHSEVMMTIEHKDEVERYMVLCRLDTVEELSMFAHGSLLAASLRILLPLAV